MTVCDNHAFDPRDHLFLPVCSCIVGGVVQYHHDGLWCAQYKCLLCPADRCHLMLRAFMEEHLLRDHPGFTELVQQSRKTWAFLVSPQTRLRLTRLASNQIRDRVRLEVGRLITAPICPDRILEHVHAVFQECKREGPPPLVRTKATVTEHFIRDNPGTMHTIDPRDHLIPPSSCDCPERKEYPGIVRVGTVRRKSLHKVDHVALYRCVLCADSCLLGQADLDEHTKDHPNHAHMWKTVKETRSQYRELFSNRFRARIHRLSIQVLIESVQLEVGRFVTDSGIPTLDTVLVVLDRCEREAPIILLGLAVWKAMCLLAVPESKCYYQFCAWIAGGWKKVKAVHQDSSAIPTIMMLVLPFVHGGD